MYTVVIEVHIYPYDKALRLFIYISYVYVYMLNIAGQTAGWLKSLRNPMDGHPLPTIPRLNKSFLIPHETLDTVASVLYFAN